MNIRMWGLALAALILVAGTAGTMSPPLAASAGESGGSADRQVAREDAGEVLRAAENERLALDFYPRTAEVVVTDLASGATWRSNPADREKDEIAKGMKKQDLHAQLLLEYVDPLNKPFQLNNYTGSIQENAFTWKRVDGGVEVVFDFPKAGFTIPVVYRLQDDAFSASIAADRLEQREKFRLVNAYLLPFFGAGDLQDEGYLFVPDGSGALIRFNNGKSIYRSYNERVYGGDAAIGATERTRQTETIRLPVFGIKRGAEAMLAVIHEGAYQAGILGEVSRKNNQYNAVSSYLNMTEFETNRVMEGSLNEKTVVRASDADAGNGPYEVRYYFLSGDDADYAGMAARYRQYLMEAQGVRPFEGASVSQIPLQLEFLGGVKKKATFLGIPYRTVEALTSYDDVRNAAARLQGIGIENLSIRYEGWAEGGLRDEVPAGLRAERKLGGENEFRSLVDEMKERGIAFYPVVDPVSLYRNGNGFYSFFDAAKSISRAPALKYEFLVSNGTRDRDVKPWYMLKPESVREAVERMSASAAEKGIERLALQRIGSVVYSDFRREMLPKNGTGRIWEESLGAAAARGIKLSYDSANAYAFPSAERLTDVPLSSSGFDVADESVPFYSIAVSGLLPAFGEPINLQGDVRTYVLKLIETGTYPSYRFIARDGSLLIGTDADELYSGDFRLWFDAVAEQFKALDDGLKGVMGERIEEHEKVMPDVYRTTYANGRTVVVNYTEETVTVDGERIEPRGYLVR